uniref:Putative secreted peptide n=1 Tax=Anopheles braziliensis TaxID=58242 RepID=A0A2M3ZXU8_9DIPT
MQLGRCIAIVVFSVPVCLANRYGVTGFIKLQTSDLRQRNDRPKGHSFEVYLCLVRFDRCFFLELLHA